MIRDIREVPDHPDLAQDRRQDIGKSPIGDKGTFHLRLRRRHLVKVDMIR